MIFRKLDNWLLDVVDRGAAWAQRRGILLTSIHVWIAAMTLVISVAVPLTSTAGVAMRTVGVVGVGTIWGLTLAVYQRWARQNQDYPVSARIMQKLNAIAVDWRDTFAFGRLTWVSVLVWCVSSDVFDIYFLPDRWRWHDLLADSAILAPTILVYLNGSFFLGPGEFAKEKREQFSGSTEFSG